MSQLSVRHLLGIKNLTESDIYSILDTATQFKDVINRPIKKVPSLRDVTIANVFLKILPVRVCRLNWQKKDFLPTSLIFPLRAVRSKKGRRYWIPSTTFWP